MRTLMFRRAVLLLGFGLLSGCATLPPPARPINVESSVIGIAVETRVAPGVLGWLASVGENVVVYFVRFDDKGPHAQERVIRSNYASDGYAYLINARPGRYAAVGVAATYQNGDMPPTTRILYFSRELIEMTVMTVPISSVVFMGEFTVRGAGAMPEGHYHEVIESGDSWSGKRWVASATESDQSGCARKRFLEVARERLVNNGWQAAHQGSVESQPVGSCKK